MRVYLHGFMGSPEDMLDLAGRSPADFSAMALPGHGAVLGETMADSLAYLLENFPPGRVDIVGYSMGGRVALMLSELFPDRVRRVVSIAGHPGLADDDARRKRAQVDDERAEALQNDPVEFLESWSKLSLFGDQQSPAWTDVLERRLARCGRRAGSWSAALRQLSVAYQDVITPADNRLLIVGSEDEKYGAVEREWRSAGGASAVVLHAHHGCHLDAPASVANVIEQFLGT